ncbi:putative transcriptional regulator [Candidatus Glomeribacter gigasporarum BEG34]|uniref:Putative transcriptional regulator n=1 Tax=Candidatus Glomeribacter gigasporarum BEG34 TaxID=1070319 RepID=G2JBU9_9BURK|nr:hypothetical protein [Candidatus Glomeribacter gigasporarum]CCD30254.1 putative transcriptional regulator [Candidatus Glomeribacter gigasporarum BEG34]
MNAAQILSNLNSGRGTISCSGEFLSDFLESYSDAGHVRDACTRKHLLANHYEAIYNGLESIDDLINVTPREIWIDDIRQRKSKLNLDSAIICSELDNVKRTEELENRVLLTKRSANFNWPHLYVNGLMKLERINIIPISSASGDKKRVIAFLTIFQDLTPRLSLDRLFYLYQGFFPVSNRKAIQHLLRHLELDHCFDPLSPLTCKEIQILLAMCKSSQCKVLAKQFDVSAPTMSNHITHIREKIVSPFTLHHVLSKLRTTGKNLITSTDFY